MACCSSGLIASNMAAVKQIEHIEDRDARQRGQGRTTWSGATTAANDITSQHTRMRDSDEYLLAVPSANSPHPVAFPCPGASYRRTLITQTHQAAEQRNRETTDNVRWRHRIHRSRCMQLAKTRPSQAQQQRRSSIRITQMRFIPDFKFRSTGQRRLHREHMR